jgi:hypothetical protein
MGFPPPAAVLSVFEVSGSPSPLVGGEGHSWSCDGFVFKRCPHQAEWTWLSKSKFTSVVAHLSAAGLSYLLASDEESWTRAQVAPRWAGALRHGLGDSNGNLSIADSHREGIGAPSRDSNV